MGRLYLRIPRGSGKPEHWQEISTNLSGPPAAGQLKLATYTGWARHVDPGVGNADLLVLRDRDGKNWAKVLYMSDEGLVVREQWSVIGNWNPAVSLRVGGLVNMGDNGLYSYRTKRDLKNPNPSYLDGVTLLPEDYDQKFYTFPIAGTTWYNGNLGFDEVSTSAGETIYQNVGWTGPSQWNPTGEPFGAIGNSESNHQNIEGHITAGVIRRRERSVLTVDTAFIRRHSTVPTGQVEKLLVNFVGSMKVVAIDLGPGGPIPSHDPATPPWKAYIARADEDAFNIEQIPTIWGSNAVAPGADTTGVVSLPSIPQGFIGPIEDKSNYPVVFDQTGSTVAEFSVPDYNVAHSVIAEVEINASDLLLDRVNFVAYTDDITHQPIEPPGTANNYTWIMFDITSVHVQVLGPDT